MVAFIVGLWLAFDVAMIVRFGGHPEEVGSLDLRDVTSGTASIFDVEVADDVQGMRFQFIGHDAALVG